MRLKLDENLSVKLKGRLFAMGHDTHTTADEGLLSRPDTEAAAAAAAEDRMLFTLDVGFADLRRHPPGNHPGIVLFRPRQLGPASVSALVESFASRADLANLAGAIVVVDAEGIRIRRRPEEQP